MTTYKEKHGTNIEVVSSDPSNPVAGQIWYNSSTNAVKGYGFVSGSWATGGALNTARNGLAGAGTQTSALAMGGETPPYSSAAEKYNGTVWTNTTSLGTARRGLMGSGDLNTAALAFGGQNNTGELAVNESSNGS